MATGPERHARKFKVTQHKHVEYYGVLIAESGDLWRARIFTYPNMLWSVPGGRGTIKFAGATAAEAEAQAIEFLTEHCTDRRLTLQESDDEKPPGRVEKEQAARLSPRGGKEERHSRKVPIRFGEKKAERAGTTVNLSRTGIYIATANPIEIGKRVRMSLDIPEYTIPLTGTVVWVRINPIPGKPRGMGVQLQQSPALYRRYVAKVEEEEECSGSAG